MSFEQIATANINIFVIGVRDSLSLQKVVPLMVGCPPILMTTAQIIGVNCGLLLGSLLIYYKGIGPAVGYLSKSLEEEFSITEHIISAVYHANWVVPICGLCFALSTVWYQELADLAYKHIKGIPKSTELVKSVADGTYATISWAMVFGQVQLLSTVSPIVAAALETVVSLVFGDNFVARTLLLLIKLASYTLQATGIVLCAALYGWYGFDPYWIASGVDTVTRFDIMEKHWAYFVGFGMPYVLITKLTSFFVGYGIFLALFPFCILMGGLSKYTDALDTQAIRPPPLPLYHPAKAWTKAVISFINTKAEQFRSKKAA